MGDQWNIPKDLCDQAEELAAIRAELEAERIATKLACGEAVDLRAERDNLKAALFAGLEVSREISAERDKAVAERDRYRAALAELVDAVRWHNADSYNRELPDWRDYAEFAPNVSPLDGHAYKTALNGSDDE